VSQTLWLKAHVREMSTLPKLTIGHGQPLPYLTSITIMYPSTLVDMTKEHWNDLDILGTTPTTWTGQEDSRYMI